MKVSAVSVYNKQNYARINRAKNNQGFCKDSVSVGQANDNVNFKGKTGKILGGLIGGVAGGAAGGAIIGGGTLAGMAAVAALGPVGAIAAAAYAIGGALAGGYVGSGIADAIEDNRNNPNKT